MLWFRNIPVAKRFMDKRGGEYQDFPSKIFCLTVPRNFVGEPFRVSLIRVSKKFLLQRVISRFSILCRIFFVSHCRKISKGNSSVLCFRRFPAAKKFMDKKKGSIKIFRRKLFVSHCRKIS